jgi:RimJ/RimL family protein N-acetyltransferase
MPWAWAKPNPLSAVIETIRTFRGNFDLDREFVYGIFNREESQVLGGCGLHPRVGDEGIEIGYWIHVEHGGRGLGTETGAALTRLAFEVHRLDRVEIHCEPANFASAAIARKLGFTHEATLRRRTVFSEDDLRDSMIWTLFASDYPNSPAAELLIEAFDVIGNKIL